MNVNGSNQINLRNNPATDLHRTLSPDGTKISNHSANISGHLDL